MNQPHIHSHAACLAGHSLCHLMQEKRKTEAVRSGPQKPLFSVTLLVFELQPPHGGLAGALRATQGPELSRAIAKAHCTCQSEMSDMMLIMSPCAQCEMLTV